MFYDEMLPFIPLSANLTNCQTHSSKNSLAVIDELFDCVCPFCGIGSYRVKFYESISNGPFLVKLEVFAFINPFHASGLSLYTL